MATEARTTVGLAVGFVMCATLLSPIAPSVAGADDAVSQSVADVAVDASGSFDADAASTDEASAEEDLPHANQRYYLGSAVNTGRDNGFSESHPIDEKDPHFGWELGRFFVSGYTRQTSADDGTPVFLKNVGDKVGLYFNLEQDIDRLNGNDKLSINDDGNGSDQQYGIRESDFGRGTLIVRHTDYQNNVGDPIIYTDYLSALVTGADTEIDLFEEGDYEVSLDYEVKDAPRKIPGVNIEVFPKYANYRISFKFSVRNGNCMVFPLDSLTGSTLTNKSWTPNGFRLDLARSRYLDIDVRREELDASGSELVEDTRFNRPAADGDEYTEEGLYVIDVRNRYTGQHTEKQIYVGSDEVMRAHAVTGEPIPEIREQLADGATIDEDGNIVLASKAVPAEASESIASDGAGMSADAGTSSSSDLTADPAANEREQTDTVAQTREVPAWAIGAIVAAVVVAAAIAAVFVSRARRKRANVGAAETPGVPLASEDVGSGGAAGPHGGTSPDDVPVTSGGDARDDGDHAEGNGCDATSEGSDGTSADAGVQGEVTRR